jgi:hypothetical protein
MIKFLVGTFILLVVFAMICISPIIAYTTDDYVTATIKSKERIENRDGDGSKYLIYTDKGVFENTDTIWYWKFRSSDLYNDLNPGQQYELRKYGFRVGFFSWYENIISAHQL